MSARDDLIQYRFLEKEVERLEELIGELEVERKRLTESDFVYGSDVEFPYAKHKVNIQGIDFDLATAVDLDNEYQNLIRQLRERKIQSKRTYLRAMSYIYEAPDVITRQALEYKYIHGMTWIQVAHKIGGNSEDSVRKMCARYLKEWK